MSAPKSSEYHRAQKMIRAFDDPNNEHIDLFTAKTGTTSELMSLYTAVVEELIDTGIVPVESENHILDWGEGLILHESQHETAARHIGGTIVSYHLRLLRPSTDPAPGVGMALEWFPPSTVTPLDKATVFAYPHEISLGDLSDLVHLGFTGPDSVGRAALAYNAGRHPDSQLLLPLSFNQNQDNTQ
jgi:hypothetical protein